MRYFIFLSLFIGIPTSCFADKAFQIFVDPINSISVQANGVSPIHKRDLSELAAKIEGTETSDCHAYGRHSSAEAIANVKILRQDDSSISFSLSNAATALGGHFRNCATCALSNCVGIFGNDTTGQATANSRALVTIKFDKEFPAADYLLNFNSSSKGISPKFKLTDRFGNEINLQSTSDQQIIHGFPGNLYYFSVDLDISVSNKGGCCKDEKSNYSVIDISVLKAPILSSMGIVEPYIRGGDETEPGSYMNVGAILIGGRLHCTGTVVGKQTILTAAHCLEGYENQLDNMSFILGTNIQQPEIQAIGISNFEYPKENIIGFKFNRNTLEDDIGLVYLKHELTVEPVMLHTGLPSWNEILDKRKNLTFVGFGYDVIEDQKVGVGIKREASWYINKVENRRVAFQVIGKNTCKGDSGGPAFIFSSRSIIQVGITSGGNSTCTEGFETRIDAFSIWLAGKIR
ncbi:trypsin-like serine protease [Methylomonas sp. EFPC3]|uniref:S1 family peptidase n=1 Tax=Methylomonas sp. EFPC3 TaxID=3021710 RepID=UPI002417BE2F|nr:trypsin-like serine protease [Methylomonas sp. EFPC3]WFP51956.1 trypsin-like serine protease [Methylomonas sp. EFPC3]